MLFNLILLLIIIIVIIYLIRQVSSISEPFTDQTRIPKDQPDHLLWDFKSPKSNIQNFNDTTLVSDSQNDVFGLKPANSGLISPSVITPTWVYPYTYMNREFNALLIHHVHQIEKEHNHQQRLSERTNNEWSQPYDYTYVTWDQCDPLIKQLII